MVVNSKIIINFAGADRQADHASMVREYRANLRSGVKRGGMQRHNIEKRLSALILDHLEFSQNFIIKSRIEQR